MAGLRYRAALHVYSHCRWEVVENLLHLLARVDKPVTGDDESGVNLRVAVERCGLLNESGVALEAFGHAEHLTHCALIAAINVVVAASRAHHHLANLETRVGTASHAGRDDQVGMERRNHLRRSHRCVHLSDAALLHYNFVLTDAAHNESAARNGLFLLVGRKSLQLCKLLVHCYDYTYAHLSSV